MAWEKEQQEIIDHRGGNLLVSASAGAGKTTVLVERIFQLAAAEDGVDLDRMLVVTFTNLAAAQMKERLQKSLQKALKQDPGNRRLARQLMLLPQSSITTIHSFCLSVVRRYISLVPDLDPGFRVAEEAENELLSLDVMEEVLERFYEHLEEKPEDETSRCFQALLDNYAGTRQDTGLVPVLMNVYRFLESQPDPLRWLEEAVSAYRTEEVRLVPVLTGLKIVLTAFMEAYIAEKKKRGLVDFHDFEIYARQILLDEEGRPTRAACEVRDGYDLIFIDEYQDSNLVQEELLNAVARRDEEGEPCNIFMVGDVKQSIYSFRAADPSLFTEKLERYHTDASPRKIFLTRNYRSRETILKAVNTVFEEIMHKDLSGVDYDADQALVPGKTFPEAPEGTENFRPVFYRLHAEGKPNAEERLNRSAAFTAERIAEMLADPWRYAVFDADRQEYRALAPSDIVILLRGRDPALVYQKALEEKHIPALTSHSERFLDTREIILAVNLLKIIDNPDQDIPLEGVLHSFLAGFSSEELSFLRIETRREISFYEALTAYAENGSLVSLRERCRAFLEQLDRWRDWSESLSVRELLEKLYRDTSLPEYVGALPGGSRRRANLDMLLERAEDFERTIYSGVFQFLRFLERLKEKDKGYEAVPESSGEASVHLMTIHASKGLQFPVVFYAGLEKGFSDRDTQGSLLLDADLGIGAKYLDPEYMTLYETERCRRIKEAKSRRMVGEEIRVMYVALTRAVERLILVGFAEEKSTKKKDEPVSAEECRSPMALLSLVEEEVLKSTWTVEDVDSVPELPVAGETAEREEQPVQGVPAADERLSEKLLWKYPYAWNREIPLKLSVSALKSAESEEPKADLRTENGRSIGEADSSEPAGRKESGGALPNALWDSLLVPFTVQPDEEAPVFAGAQGGTLFHRSLEHFDLKKLHSETGRREEVARLVQKEYLTPEEGDAFPFDWLRLFSESDLCRRMENADALVREMPFLISLTPGTLRKLVPGYRLPEEATEEEEILLQGIIDAAFRENRAWVIADYKTDRSFPEKSLAAYARQLDLYAYALRQITGSDVKEKLLYQARKGRVLNV